MIRNYTDLRQLKTLDERFDYLKLGGEIGRTTFGFDRWINQQFYRSREWKLIRQEIIARDMGFDLGAEDVPIMGAYLIHHMNPLTLEDFEDTTENLLDPEYLITVSLRTHNAVHYGDKSQLPQPYVERTPGDTKLW